MLYYKNIYMYIFIIFKKNIFFRPLRSEDKQILKLDFPVSATNSPFVDKRARPDPRGSQVNKLIYF